MAITTSHGLSDRGGRVGVDRFGFAVDLLMGVSSVGIVANFRVYGRGQAGVARLNFRSLKGFSEGGAFQGERLSG